MNYEDIINTRYPFKLKHSRMSIYNRSAIFASFAALKGYSESIDETARITEEKVELDEYQKEIINNKLQLINKSIKNKPLIIINYFVKDNKKKGGKYITIKERVKKIDLYNSSITLLNNMKISINNIIEINLLQ